MEFKLAVALNPISLNVNAVQDIPTKEILLQTIERLLPFRTLPG